MFFTFSQNNSGGSFVINKNVAPYVIVEADSADEANHIAEGLGIYFDGVADGYDCECCGDRWYPQWKNDSGTDKPEVYGEHPADASRVCVPKNKTVVRVYYKSGKKESF